MTVTAPAGSAQRTLQWAQNNVGAGARKIRAWDSKAGFAPGTAWCGIFLGNAMRAQGLPTPRGYAAAANWSGYGSAVKSLREAQPGDILVYGSNHVAMYLGGGRQIQGNDANGTVGTSAAGAGIGLGPITAIRRPPYRGGSAKGGGSGGLLEEGFNTAGAAFGSVLPEGPAAQAVAENLVGVGENVIPNIPSASQIAAGVEGDLLGSLAEHAEPLMLNIGLLALAGFFIYYGAALLLGAKSPVATPVKAAAKVGTTAVATA